MNFTTEVCFLRLVLAKAYGLSVTLHELEVKGVILTKKQDDRWAQFTKTSEALKTFYRTEGQEKEMKEYFQRPAAP